MAIPLRIGETEGAALQCDAALLLFSAPKAFPPGQPVAFVLWPDTPEALPLAGRSLGSKRRQDGAFDVRVRLVNLSRAARDRLLTAFSPG